MSIEVRNLSKAYGDKIILDSLNLTIADGDIVCIQGESGRGKTTLFRLLMGLEHSDSGEIEMREQRISAVFQEERLFEGLNPIKNIRFAVGNQISKEAIQEHLVQILPEDCQHKPIRKFSGGMKRRVSILRAILAESDILIFDEPFGGLDDETKDKVIAYIKKYRNNRILLYATHDKDEVRKLGGRIVEL